MKTPSLDDYFQSCFDIRLADTPELLEQVYRIRYDVYCREFHYEREEDYPDGLERDQYDAHSLQMLIVHKTSNKGVGCVRMIRPPLDDSTFLLPLERHFGHALNHPDRHPQLIPRHCIAEISRLAVHTSFRQRLGEAESPFGALIGQREFRTFPLVSLALFAGATALLALDRRQHMFVIMEPRLARRLKSLGFPFVQTGEMMDYHGLRTPYHVTVDECQRFWGHSMSVMFDFVHRELLKSALCHNMF